LAMWAIGTHPHFSRFAPTASSREVN